MPPLHCVSMCEPRGLGSGWAQGSQDPPAPAVRVPSLVSVPSARGMLGEPSSGPQSHTEESTRRKRAEVGYQGDPSASSLLTSSFTSALRFHRLQLRLPKERAPLSGTGRAAYSPGDHLASHVFWGPCVWDRGGTLPQEGAKTSEGASSLPRSG